jgi:hypothetical protein
VDFKGALVAALGIFLVFIAATGRYKDVWAALTYRSGQTPKGVKSA